MHGLGLVDYFSNYIGGRVGGAFSENKHATWRWAFYINLCIGAAFSPIYIFCLPRGDPQKHIKIQQKLLQIDYLGMILNIGALTALIMAINFGGNIFAWDSDREIALWVVGGVILLLFVVQQAFTVGTTDTERVFPPDFLRMPLMWLLFCLMCCAATCVFVSTRGVLMGFTDAVTGPDILHPPAFPVCPGRFSSGCSRRAASIYLSHGVLWLCEWRSDDKGRMLHAVVFIRRDSDSPWRWFNEYGSMPRR